VVWKNLSKEELKKLKISQKRKQQAEKLSKQIKNAILTALAIQDLTFEQLIEKTGYSRQTIANYVKKLWKEGLIFKKPAEKGFVYSLRKITSKEQQFVSLVTSYLHHSLEHDSIETFNRKLGSLVMFAIKNNKISYLKPILKMLEAYITPATLFKETEYEIQYKPPEIKTEEWQIWEDALNTNYLEKRRFYKDGLSYTQDVINYPKFAEKWLKQKEGEQIEG